jgi:hypothetical protein
LGFRLLIPRGQLDISYRDLFFVQGVLHNYITMRRYRNDKEITSQWKDAGSIQYCWFIRPGR